VNTGARLLLATYAGLTAGVLAGDPNVSKSDEPPAQSSAQAASPTVAQSPAVAPAGPSPIGATTPPDPSSGGKPGPGTQPGESGSSPASAGAQTPANKPGRKALVDDTVTDAQLKQILRKGYEPERQARGNEVYYCRREHDLGSRFETKVCRTAARILQDEQQGKEATTNVERTDGNRPLK
jgi:hypothetical protein